MTIMKLFLCFLFTAMCFSTALSSAAGERLEDTEKYGFKVIGHAYPLIKQLKPILDGDPLVIFTGDVVYDGCKDWSKFAELTALIAEVHVAPGNHDKDILCPENWEDERLFYEFNKNGDQFIILDSVHYKWSIEREQLSALKEAFSRPARNRFLFMHNAIHYNDPDFQTWLPNSLAGHHDEMTFTKDVKPILESRDDVYVFMGDYGNRNAGFHEQTTNGVHYIGAGLSAREAAVTSSYTKIGVSANGRVWITHKLLMCDIPDADKPNVNLCARNEVK